MTRLSKIQAKIALSFCTLFSLYFPAAFSQQVDTAWVRRYNGPGNGDDKAVAIAVDSSGNVYVTGSSFDSTTGYDFCTIKYLPNGDTAWVRRYDGPGRPDGLEGQNDYAVALALDKAGNVYVTGTAATPLCLGGYGSRDIVTIKYLPNGDTGWLRGTFAAFCERADISALGLAMDCRSNLYIAGQGFHPLYGWYGFTTKYDSDGDVLWGAPRGLSDPSYDVISPIAVDSTGSSICVIGSDGIFKYDSLGNEVWARNFPGTSRAIALDNSGNAYLTGSSGNDYATIKYLPNGDTVWLRSYSGPGGFGDYAYAIEVDGFGNVYIAGESNGPGTSQDFATIKYYPNGDTAWIRRYNGSGNDNEERPSLAIDNSGNVYITGPSADVGSVYDYATIKYDSLGNQVWVKRYDGPAHSDDHSNAITVDALGNVYVTGRSLTDTTYDYATIKYAPLPQLKGDLNLDGILNLNDVVFALNCTFLGASPPAAPAACDINCDGKITPADVVILLLMVFSSAPAPC